LEPLHRYRAFVFRITSDPRITATHISLTTAICYNWILNPSALTIQVSRKQLMRLSHIRSIATYHKVIKELHSFGYIDYKPSYHPKNGSTIALRMVSELTSVNA
jgi:hypothetical protein